jgi:hypothetical protein
MRFEYASWWRDAQLWGDPCEDVLVQEYTPDYVAIKYDTNQDAKPFLCRSFVARRLIDGFAFVQKHNAKYVHGAYVAFQEPSSQASLRKKKLFVVDVTKKSVAGEDDFVFVADHWSFVVNHNASDARKLSFHRTVYNPIAPSYGSVSHIYNPLPLCFDIPTTAGAFRDQLIRERKLAPYTEWVYDIFSTQQSSVSGGGSSEWKQARKSNKASQSFDDAWRRLPIKSMILIAIPHGQVHDVTVFIESRLRNSTNSQSRHIRVPSRNMRNVQKHVGDALRGTRWSDFVQEDGDVDSVIGE